MLTNDKILKNIVHFTNIQFNLKIEGEDHGHDRTKGANNRRAAAKDQKFGLSIQDGTGSKGLEEADFPQKIELKVMTKEGGSLAISPLSAW